MSISDKIMPLTLGLGIGAIFGYVAANQGTVKAPTSSPEVLPGLKVVDIDGKLRIYEHAGNASNGDGRVSVAQVTVTEPMEEAVQVPQFDEYVLILTGEMIVYVGSEDAEKRPPGRTEDEPFVLKAKAGQTLQLPKGHLYRYTFPGPCTYVPVCLPAFSPEIAGRIE